MSAQPVVSVVVPTHNRADYLDVTLSSLAAQDFSEPWEVIVVDDGSSDGTAGALEGRPVRALRHERPRGPNAARNTGIHVSSAELIALVDDDVLAPPGWLAALVAGARAHPEAEALGGPIRARLEGRPPRSCGRESPPVTTLDLGPTDRAAEMLWSANLLLRSSALERVGGFDEDLPIYGDEEEWIERLRERGGRLAYIAAAGLEHRRDARDARLGALMRSEFRRGRSSRALDVRKGRRPGLAGELRVLAGCGWHTVRRACPQGLVLAAHSAGRVREAVRF